MGSRTGASARVRSPQPSAGRARAAGGRHRGRTRRRVAGLPRTSSPAWCPRVAPGTPRGENKAWLRGRGLSARRPRRRGSQRGGSCHPRPPRCSAASNIGKANRGRGGGDRAGCEAAPDRHPRARPGPAGGAKQGAGQSRARTSSLLTGRRNGAGGRRSEIFSFWKRE